MRLKVAYQHLCVLPYARTILLFGFVALIALEKPTIRKCRQHAAARIRQGAKMAVPGMRTYLHQRRTGKLLYLLPGCKAFTRDLFIAVLHRLPGGGVNPVANRCP